MGVDHLAVVAGIVVLLDEGRVGLDILVELEAVYQVVNQPLDMGRVLSGSQLDPLIELLANFTKHHIII